jgi:hypothetical protein
MTDASDKVHGMMFLVPAAGARLLGMAVVMSHSLLWGCINLALIVASFAAVIYFYCAKCTAGKVCGDCRNVFCVLKKRPASPRPSLEK